MHIIVQRWIIIVHIDKSLRASYPTHHLVSKKEKPTNTSNITTLRICYVVILNGILIGLGKLTTGSLHRVKFLLKFGLKLSKVSSGLS